MTSLVHGERNVKLHWWGDNKGIVEKGGIVGRLAVRFLARTTYSTYMARTRVMKIKEFMTKLDGNMIFVIFCTPAHFIGKRYPGKFS